MNDLSVDFKNALSCLGAGVTVITYSLGGKMGGLTATSFTSVSLDPPLVLFCVKKTAASHDEIQQAGAFAVNMLSSSQENISNGFAGKEDKQKLANENGFTLGKTGSPFLNGSLASLDCEIENIYPGGDHSIVVGRVVQASSDSKQKPLLYFQREYHSL